MAATRVGSSLKYADGWARAFGGGKKTAKKAAKAIGKRTTKAKKAGTKRK